MVTDVTYSSAWGFQLLVYKITLKNAYVPMCPVSQCAPKYPILTRHQAVRQKELIELISLKKSYSNIEILKGGHFRTGADSKLNIVSLNFIINQI